MTESFILAAFRKMGEDPTSVRLMRNKYNGEPAGYCFVSFKAEEAAMDAMHKLNGKPIPGTNPTVRFRLNNATNNSSRTLVNDREYSVWVGDLSSEVDDYNLYRVFSSKYTSIKTAKVILDSSGFSKGYGFVKFGIEEEQQDALYKMNGYLGLGSKPIKICNAVPKPKETGTSGFPTAQSIISGQYDYSQYYDASTAYWQNYNWQSYYDQQGHVTNNHQQQQQHHHHQTTTTPTTVVSAAAMPQKYAVADNQKEVDEDMALVEHNVPIDIDKLNNETNERDCNLWDALERSKWLPIEQLEIVSIETET